MPGLVEGHSHLLLHPYNETTWNDQVLKEPLAYRVARAVTHAERTLMAGVTTVRDLGTEGAGYADVGTEARDRRRADSRPAHAGGWPGDGGHGQLRTERLRLGIHACRRAPTKPTVVEGVTRVARNQIGHGVDLIKIYADYRWGPNGETRATFTVERNHAPSSRRRRAAGEPWSRMPPRPKACAAPSSAAWRRSSTATRARPRSGS